MTRFSIKKNTQYTTFYVRSKKKLITKSCVLCILALSSVKNIVKTVLYGEYIMSKTLCSLVYDEKLLILLTNMKSNSPASTNFMIEFPLTWSRCRVENHFVYKPILVTQRSCHG